MNYHEKKRWIPIVMTALLPVVMAFGGSGASAMVSSQSEGLPPVKIDGTQQNKVIYDLNNITIRLGGIEPVGKTISLQCVNNTGAPVYFSADSRKNRASSEEEDTALLIEKGDTGEINLDFSEEKFSGDLMGLSVKDEEGNELASAKMDLNAEVFSEAGRTQQQEAQDQITALTDEKEELESAVRTAEEEKAALTEQISSLETKTGELETTIDSLMEQVADLTEKKTGLEEQVQQAEKSGEELAGENQALTDQIAELDGQISSLLEAAETLETNLDTLSSEKEALDQALTEKTAEAEGLAADLETKTAEAEGLAADLEAKTAEAEGLAADLETKTAEAEGLAADLEAKTAEAEGLAADLEAKTAEAEQLGGDLESMTAEEAARSADLAAKTAEAEQLTADLAERDASIAELEEVVSQLTAENERMQLTIDPGLMENPENLLSDVSIEYHDWSAVRAVQIALNEAGFNCGPVDCIYGPKTEAGIRSYQQAMHLTENGIITEELVESLKENGLITDSIFNHTDNSEYYTYLKYWEIDQGADNLVGTRVAVTGRILQNAPATEDAYAGYLRLAVRGDNSSVLFVTYHEEGTESELAEGSEITVYGRCVGHYTYESLTGEEKTVPWMMAHRIEDVQKDEMSN